MTAPRHTTTWEDAQMAGVACNGVHIGSISSYEDEPWICDRCGTQLKLIWAVRLEEVPKAEPQAGGTTKIPS